MNLRRAASFGLLMAALVAVRLVSPGAPADATFPDANGKIAFVRAGHIFVMNADGTEVTQLTGSPANHDFAPDWSPDGTKIAFTRTRGVITSGGDIWLVSADGSALTRLTNDPGVDRDPAWSPDGAQIAFSSDRDGYRDGIEDFEIFVMASDGSGLRQLTNAGDGYVSASPSWSPDGTRIAFERGGQDIPSDICVMAADGDGQTNLTTTPEFERSPGWSPDGSSIVFTYQRESFGSSTVRSVNRAGGDLHQLVNEDAGVGDAAWSPDGSKMAFVASVPERGSGIFVMNSDGSDRTMLAEGDASPVWQPIPRRDASSITPVPLDRAMPSVVASSTQGCVPLVPGRGTPTPAPELPVGGGPSVGGDVDLSFRQVALVFAGLLLAAGGLVLLKAWARP